MTGNSQGRYDEELKAGMTRVLRQAETIETKFVLPEIGLKLSIAIISSSKTEY
jgi:hypothetical protein